MSSSQTDDAQTRTDRAETIPFLVCPETKTPLSIAGDQLTSAAGTEYAIDNGIPRLFVHEHDDGEKETVTEEVREFYEESPFPNYNGFDNIGAFIKRASESWFARSLSDEIAPNSNVLEVGCGTGQLSNYLAATTMCRVWGADMTLPSLRLAHTFAQENQLSGVQFVQMNLFRPCVREASVDYLITNGVLHHTRDTGLAYHSIAPLVKPGGYILVGLYNSLGRLRTKMRGTLIRAFGKQAHLLDPHLRKDMSPDKRRAWIRDQYFHPCERSHRIEDVLRWFDESGVDFVSSIPPIARELNADSRLFEPSSPGTSFDRFAAELGMLFRTFGGEGGLFIVIGRRRHT